VARGKSREELIELLTIEYRKRDLDIAAPRIAMEAEKLRQSQKAFGRARGALFTLRTMGALGSAGVNAIRRGAQEDPEWMRPPPSASYPVRSGRRSAEVVLAADAARWLERAANESRRRVGPLVPIELWLTESVGGTVQVHLGEQAIGTLAPLAAEAFSGELSAASLFDEQPFVKGHIALIPDGESLLEIALPASRAADD
jgi:hypothetical protein